MRFLFEMLLRGMLDEIKKSRGTDYCPTGWSPAAKAQLHNGLPLDQSVLSLRAVQRDAYMIS